MIVDALIFIFILFYVHINYFILLLSAITFNGKQKKKTAEFPTVSVIIASKNEENVIEETLKRVKSSDYPRDKLEIIVVDSSTDKTPEISRKYADKIIIDKAGKGKPHALNQAVGAARNEVLYFLDADTWVRKDTIRNIVTGISSKHPVCCGLILHRNKNTLIAKIGRLQAAFLFFSFQTWLNKIVKTSILSGKNFALRKSELLKIGRFENVLTEDINISLRLYKSGKKVHFSTDAVVYDQIPDKIKHYWKQQERWYGGGTNEIRKMLVKMTFYELLILIPMIICMIASSVISFLLLIAFIITGDYFLLAAPILWLSTAVYASAKFLDKNEIILLPIIYFMFVAIQTALFLNLFIKKLLGIKIEWYKTPKDRL